MIGYPQPSSMMFSGFRSRFNGVSETEIAKNIGIGELNAAGRPNGFIHRIALRDQKEKCLRRQKYKMEFCGRADCAEKDANSGGPKTQIYVLLCCSSFLN